MTEQLSLFWKDDNYVAIAMRASDTGGVIITLDMLGLYNALDALDTSENFFEVVEKYEKAVNESINNGWKLFHQGKPNVG